MLNINEPLVKKPGPNSAQRSDTAVWQLGFRPFFLAAGLWALTVMLVWMAVYSFGLQLNLAGLPPTLWHGHEMLFGYVLAVIAGFLLTAVRNWTGVQTINGALLAGLFSLWLAARLLPLVPEIPLLAMAVPDVLFGLLLLAAVAWPVIKVRQWKQLIIVSIIALLVGLNSLFYARGLGWLAGDMRWALLAAVWLVLLLIVIMAGRVVPMFMQNGIGGGVQVVRYRWIERLAVPSVLLFVLVQLAAPQSALLPWVAGAAALIHAARVFGWYLPGLWRVPLVWVLYVGYAWLVVGLSLYALSAWWGAAALVALHALVAGVMATITLGMMSRVTIGHTGRMMASPPAGLTLIFVLITLAALVRVLLPMLDMGHYGLWIASSQGLWVAAFTLFVYRFAMMLWRPRVDGQPG